MQEKHMPIAPDNSPFDSWTVKVKSLWEKFSSQELFTKVSILFLLIMVLVTPVIIANRTGLLSHAGTSLLTNCTPIPTGFTQDQIQQLSKDGSVKWCGQNNLLGENTTNAISFQSGMADTFGQYAGANWAGKIKTIQDISTLRDQENYLGKVSGTDAYGGLMAITIPNSTGNFLTTQYNGRWILVTPLGHPFYSIGMDVATNSSPTIVQNREDLFQYLPSSTDPLNQFYGTYNGQKTYDFYKANLYKANNNNTNFQADWENRTYNRLISWGFNTLANWSDKSLYNQQKMPYVVAINTYQETNAKLFQVGTWTGAPSMPDVFDSSFNDTSPNGSAETAIKDHVFLCANNPYCIGVFIDNEIPFSGWVSSGTFALARAVLGLPASWQAKISLTTGLQNKYQTITNLNNAWSTSFTSWEDFQNKNIILPTTLNTAQTEDLHKFTAGYTYKYFAVVSRLTHKYLPGKLYLGSRFLTFDTPIEALNACLQYCDVMSFNQYRTTLNTTDLNFFKTSSKPIIIGEFHFTASDRGLAEDTKAPNIGFATQAERAQAYTNYVQSALSIPTIVGYHWFEYRDEPVTYREEDTENYNVGFVTIADTVYPELASAATSINRSVYQKIFNIQAPTPSPTPIVVTNIAPNAIVSVSSTFPPIGSTTFDGSHVKDGSFIQEWASYKQLTPWVQLNWPSVHTISDIKLFDRPNTIDKIGSGVLTFSDGSTVSVGQLPDTGSAYDVKFTPKNGITWVKFQVTAGAGQNVGLLEFQVFGQ